MRVITLYKSVPTDDRRIESEVRYGVADPLVQSFGIFVADGAPETKITANPGSICIVKGPSAPDNGLWYKVTGYKATGWALANSGGGGGGGSPNIDGGHADTTYGGVSPISGGGA